MVSIHQFKGTQILVNISITNDEIDSFEKYKKNILKDAQILFLVIHKPTH